MLMTAREVHEHSHRRLGDRLVSRGIYPRSASAVDIYSDEDLKWGISTD